MNGTRPRTAREAACGRPATSPRTAAHNTRASTCTAPTIVATAAADDGAGRQRVQRPPSMAATNETRYPPRVLPTISTPRLRLRALRADDAADVFKIFSDAEGMRYWSAPPLTDLAGAAELIDDSIAAWADDPSLLQWGIVRADDDRVLGTCTIADIDLAHHRAGLGYALGRASWGRGFAREAVRALLDFGFHALELHRVAADCDPRNTRSLRLLDDLGFTREGVQRECYRVRDEWQDAVMFGLLRRDWLDRADG